MTGRHTSGSRRRKTEERNRLLVVLLLAIWLISGVLFAQSKVRGVSPPGRIGFLVKSNEMNPSKIVCTVDFEEPSGDRTLSEGETGNIVVYVRNYHEGITVQPKLELLIQAGREVKPIFRMESLGKIPPGKLAVFRKEMAWHDHLPPGTVTVRVRILDTQIRFVSDSIQMRFNVRGPAAALDPRECRWEAEKPAG